ncbi:2-amino-4-hydroxy-6-hydroxymethyldihydropteridine diphosphokinase [Rhodoferax sp.]|uniref:2-amino-4-hydroxy-6- hydroxymethyldihydropteridine diphosphokinase n=1 Tax=Rhodoferax sp. TaxID=50421 RepID=UPI002770BEF1|nr:2-amino-4-hydroxy-6-hydroxymethyldihydropteridine diphosphokinase [Rhodoferax sp.]
MSEAALRGVTAYIGLGANLGDARASVLLAIDAIAALAQTTLRRRSGLYRSAPVDAVGPDFINAVVEVSTTLTAPALLDELHTLERAAGRTRPYHHAPRSLDLDLLLYGDAFISSGTLMIPHPRMTQRAFVLRPLAQIAPNRVTAADLQATAHQAVERVPDQ